MIIRNKKIRKRYLISIIAILFAILSVLLLRTFDINYERKKIMTEKEIIAIMEFNKDFFIKEQLPKQSTKILRDNFANRISYKKLFDNKEDFRNFKYLPDKDIYGFQMLNNAHVGFYYNSDKCGNYAENKDYCIGVIIDTNGYTRPNKFGEDQYLLKIYKDIIKE